MNPGENINFDAAVEAHHRNLFRFALSLTGSESDAGDLAQAAFERLLRKSGQLRDPSKVKTWLFTTLYRLFLEQYRRAERYPRDENIELADIPATAPGAEEQMDAATVCRALQQIEEPFRSAVTLFYLQEYSYREIAEILDVPIGTVMSRLSRGKMLLRALLSDPESKIIPLPLKVAS